MVYNHYFGVTKDRLSRISLFVAALAFAVAGAFAVLSTSFTRAAHNPAEVGVESGACGETTFTAAISEPEGTHKVDNMRLVVHADGVTEVTDPIPTDGSEVSVTVGPFFGQAGDTETVQWRVFGGGERNYDDPLWNGFGDATFTDDINDYAADVGGFDWTIAGPEDPNPFTTWNTMEVDACAITKDMCKKGGFENFGFRNQGLCIQFVNTGKDSREA